MVIGNVYFFLFIYSKSDMSRLRLAAGSAIMKLAQEPCYHEIITPEQFQLCALVINVSGKVTSNPSLEFDCIHFSLSKCV